MILESLKGIQITCLNTHILLILINFREMLTSVSKTLFRDCESTYIHVIYIGAGILLRVWTLLKVFVINKLSITKVSNGGLKSVADYWGSSTHHCWLLLLRVFSSPLLTFVIVIESLTMTYIQDTMTKTFEICETTLCQSIFMLQVINSTKMYSMY